MEPKYPEVKVKLLGEDDNPLAILGRCKQALRAVYPSRDKWEPIFEEFATEAKAGDYNHLLMTVARYFTVEDPND